MFKNIFNPDTPLMITIAQITDCIFISLFWFVCCMPVITIGPATAAMYDAVWRGFRKGDKRPWQRFWHSFKQNLVPGMISTVPFLILLCLGGWILIQLWNNAVYANISWAVFAGAAFILLLLLGILSIIFPMLSRFENGFGALWGNSFRLGLARLPSTLVLAGITAVTMWLCFRFIFPLFFLPALSALISSLLIEPMFRPWMPEEDEE